MRITRALTGSLLAMGLAASAPGAAFAGHSYDNRSADAVAGAGCDPGDKLDVPGAGGDAAGVCGIDDGDAGTFGPGLPAIVGSCCGGGVSPLVASTCSIGAVVPGDPRNFDMDAMSIIDPANPKSAVFDLTFSCDDRENLADAAPPDSPEEKLVTFCGGANFGTGNTEGIGFVTLAGPPPPPQSSDDDVDAFD